MGVRTGEVFEAVCGKNMGIVGVIDRQTPMAQLAPI
jgi:hypothetical protein